MIYLTSDRHFNHKNICGKDGFEPSRKNFKGVEEMNAALLEAHNSVVTDNDTVYDHGDFSLHNKSKDIINLLEQMNGSMELILGNHDSHKTWRKIYNHFEGKKVNGKPKLVLHNVGFVTNIDKLRLYHSHFPMEIGMRRGLFNIHGHIHSQDSNYLNQINVGVDASNRLFRQYEFGKPIAMEALVEYLKWCHDYFVEQDLFNQRKEV